MTASIRSYFTAFKEWILGEHAVRIPPMDSIEGLSVTEHFYVPDSEVADFVDSVPEVAEYAMTDKGLAEALRDAKAWMCKHGTYFAEEEVSLGDDDVAREALMALREPPGKVGLP